MAPSRPGQTPIFGVIFFVCKSPLGTEGQKKLENFAAFIVGILTSFRFFFIFHVTNLIVNSRIIVFCHCKAHESIFLCILRYRSNKIIIIIIIKILFLWPS